MTVTVTDAMIQAGNTGSSGPVRLRSRRSYLCDPCETAWIRLLPMCHELRWSWAPD
jgi:hypothetical protein